MQKKNDVLSRPLVCGLLASFCCLLWGSVVPFLNVGYREFVIGAGDTAALILFAGARFFLAGILTLAFACAKQRRFVRPKQGNWNLALKLSLVQTALQYLLFYVFPVLRHAYNWKDEHLFSHINRRYLLDRKFYVQTWTSGQFPILLHRFQHYR